MPDWEFPLLSVSISGEESSSSGDQVDWDTLTTTTCPLQLTLNIILNTTRSAERIITSIF